MNLILDYAGQSSAYTSLFYVGEVAAVSSRERERLRVGLTEIDLVESTKPDTQLFKLYHVH